VQDQTIGLFNPSTRQWRIDNGNGGLDACASAPTTTQDACFSYGDPNNAYLPVTGDWDGNGSITVGVYRTNTSPQQFQLRNSNTSGAANITLNTGPPSLGYQPVAGKWAGMAGKENGTKVGVFQSSNGNWYLDNGDFNAAGCSSGDICFNTAAWTRPGDRPIAGDWDGNGTVTVGVHRPSDSKFYLSNALPPTGVSVIIGGGPPEFGYLPIVADWTGRDFNNQTRTKIGVFRPSTGGWYLATTANPTTCHTDLCYNGPFGGSGDLPVAFGASVIRAN